MNNNLFAEADVNNILLRIDKLTPQSERKWGRMTVDQMLAHCALALKVPNNEDYPPRIFIGRIIGPYFKKRFFADTKVAKNTPTIKSFIIKDQRDFEKEKQLLKDQIEKFSKGGEMRVTRHPHAFFGKLTPMEWSIGMWKHLDHHLQQFGV